MPLNNMGLGFLFTAQNLAGPTFRRVQSDLQQTARASDAMSAKIDASMQAVKAGALLAGAGAIGLGISLNLAGAAGKFEMGLAGVAAVSRATTGELKQLEQAAIAAGIETQFSPTEAIEGLRNLTVSGFTAQEAITALKPALDLAAGGQISIAQASATTASALRAFGLEAEQAGITADKLLRISNATALQAGDLEMALGNVARGAGLTEQSIDEMLPSIGLLRNTGVDASVAANAVSSALIFMSKTAKKFDEVGVKVTDARGNFRPFLDIVLEADRALGSRFPNAADRASRATDLFGRFGVTAFQAISKQAKTGIRAASGEILRGADAIAYLRKQMATAGGAAAEFRAKLLSTYEGQKILLTGTLQTAAVVFGKPFARVLRPIVSIVTDAINALIKLFRSLPDRVQSGIAAFVVLLSSLALTVGGVLLLKGALGLLGITIGGIVGLIGGAIASILPFILAIGAVIAVIALFYEAYRRNIGGLGDFAGKTWERVKLFWTALMALFTEGGFSGALRKELSRAEHQGIKAFAIQVFLWVNRIKAFFGGIAEGVSNSIDRMGPAFDGLVSALTQVGRAFGFVATGPGNPVENADKFYTMANAGIALGEVLSFLAVFMMDVLAVTLNLIAAIVAGLRGSFEDLGPVVSVLAKIFSFAFGVIGDIITGIASIFRLVLWLPMKHGLGILIDLLTGDFVGAWRHVRTMIAEVLNSVISMFGSAVRLVARAVDGIAATFGKDLGAGRFVDKTIESIKGAVSRGLGVEVETAGAGAGLAPTQATIAAAAAMPVVGAREAAAKAERVQYPSLGLSEDQMRRIEMAMRDKGAITIQLDSEVLASSVRGATKRQASQSFAPVPTG